MKKIVFAGSLLLSVNAAAQDSSLQAKPLSFTGYLETYYSYDFNQPPSNNRPGFLYNFNRHNEFAINLAFLKAAYSKQRTRANLALAAGTYVSANYASEPGVLKNLFEANVGYRLTRNKNLWFDIGIMPSHIGFETAIGKENWTLTRSLVAESTPYFESGAKLTYTSKNEKFLFSILALNGWQRITRLEGASLASWGTQLTYKPTKKFTVNYSTFVGTDKPDSTRRLRYHNNLYGIFRITGKVGFIANLDYGLEQKSPNSSRLNKWYTPVAIIRFTPNSTWAVAVRGEYFSDRNSVIVSAGTTNSFAAFGSSMNIDYLPEPNIALRLEGRYFSCKDEIFRRRGLFIKDNAAITFSTAVNF